MKRPSTAAILCASPALLASLASAFAPRSTASSKATTISKSSVTSNNNQPSPKQNEKGNKLYDPFGLYPKSSAERKEGRLQPLEDSSMPDRSIKDPLGLYSDQSQVDDRPMSSSLPFLQRPALLDGTTLPGDRGFDPLNFCRDEEDVQWYRTAEVKHARLAMLATAGWVGAELWNQPLAHAFDLPSLLGWHDRVPSVLNGGLDKVSPAFWAVALGIAFALESFGETKRARAAEAGATLTPGDLGFDPLGLSKNKTPQVKKELLEAELFQGRLAMLAITGFALQEWWTQNAVVHETPIFFLPMNVALQQAADAAAAAATLN